MLLSEFGRGVAIGLVAATLAFGKPIVELLIAVAAIEGILEVFSVLAERSYIGSIVEGDQVSLALIRTEARAHVVVVAGRPLGVLLFSLSPIFPFLADIASFAYSVTALLSIKDSPAPHETTDAQGNLPSSKASLANDIRQGLHWMRGNNFARTATLSFSIGTLAFQALIIVFLGEAHSQQFSALSIGIVLGASGIGGTFGSMAANRLLPKGRYSWLQIQSVTWFAGFALLILLIGHWFLFTALIMAILGMTGAMGNVQLDTHLMSVEQAMRARAASVVRLTSVAAAAIGPVLGGVLFQKFGSHGAMLLLWALTGVPLAISAYMALTSLRDVRRARARARARARHNELLENYAHRNYVGQVGT